VPFTKKKAERFALCFLLFLSFAPQPRYILSSLPLGGDSPACGGNVGSADKRGPVFGRKMWHDRKVVTDEVEKQVLFGY